MKHKILSQLENLTKTDMELIMKAISSKKTTKTYDFT